MINKTCLIYEIKHVLKIKFVCDISGFFFLSGRNFFYGKEICLVRKKKNIPHPPLVLNGPPLKCAHSFRACMTRFPLEIVFEKSEFYDT